LFHRDFDNCHNQFFGLKAGGKNLKTQMLDIMRQRQYFEMKKIWKDLE
jgi:hypothetical protein